MGSPFSAMDSEELLKEFLLLCEVHQNLEHLVIYNPNLQQSIENVNSDLKQIKGQLFFRYQNQKKINLDTVIVTGSEFQTRMQRYLLEV